MLLRAINLSGKLHVVPALICEDYVIRFAVCAENAKEIDVTSAWEMIQSLANVVLETCDVENDVTMRELQRITSLEVRVTYS